MRDIKDGIGWSRTDASRWSRARCRSFAWIEVLHVTAGDASFGACPLNIMQVNAAFAGDTPRYRTGLDAISVRAVAVAASGWRSTE